MTRHLYPLLAAASLALASPAQAQDYTVEVLQDKLDRPWALDFLPGTDRVALTLRGGAVLLWHPDGLVDLAGAPEVVFGGQGGLLDIAAAPDFAESGLLYMTWTGAAEGGSTTHLGRARLQGMALRDLDVLHAVTPGIDSDAHFGSRIAFADGHVFAGFGDRGFKNFGPNHIAQDLASENGSVIRGNMLPAPKKSAFPRSMPPASIPPCIPAIDAWARPSCWFQPLPEGFPYT